jgi:hypothetical protein
MTLKNRRDIFVVHVEELVVRQFLYSSKVFAFHLCTRYKSGVRIRDIIKHTIADAHTSKRS